jgi:hypothetical protein
MKVYPVVRQKDDGSVELHLWTHGENPTRQVFPMDLAAAQALSVDLGRAVLRVISSKPTFQESVKEISPLG